MRSTVTDGPCRVPGTPNLEDPPASSSLLYSCIETNSGAPVYEQEQRHRTIMVAETAAEADLIATTLAAHGIAASTAAPSYVGAYPSVDWVRGYHVEVPAHEIDRARDVLDALSGASNAAPVDGSNVEGEDSGSSQLGG